LFILWSLNEETLGVSISIVFTDSDDVYF